MFYTEKCYCLANVHSNCYLVINKHTSDQGLCGRKALLGPIFYMPRNVILYNPFWWWNLQHWKSKNWIYISLKLQKIKVIYAFGIYSEIFLQTIPLFPWISSISCKLENRRKCQTALSLNLRKTVVQQKNHQRKNVNSH